MKVVHARQIIWLPPIKQPSGNEELNTTISTPTYDVTRNSPEIIKEGGLTGREKILLCAASFHHQLYEGQEIQAMFLSQ